MAYAGEPADPWWYIPEELRIRYDQEFVSIPNAVRISAWRYPAAEALVDEGQRWTFAGLEEAILASVRSVLAIGTMDVGGYVRITDRKKDMILVGGFNVYPAEVERILWQHPAVSGRSCPGWGADRVFALERVPWIMGHAL